jgi:hypothetical protein
MAGSLFFKDPDTLTPPIIMNSYVAAYHAVYGTKPNIEHLEGHWYIVDGYKRQRYWLLLEIERLRQQALSEAMSTVDPNNRVMRIIRRLARL